jgi:tripartite-type tricarboxylate transporter receptor subunit TctC
MIVSFSAGSGSDMIGRILARGLATPLGQPVIVENRAGGSGSVGAELAARAPADGHTLLLANMAHATNATLYRNPGYDLRRDFAPVTQVATSPSVIVLHPSVAVRSLADFVKLAKNRPDDIAYASGGIGTATFVAGELFKAHAGIKLLHVPYRSGGEALTAVLSAEVSAYFAPLATALAHMRQYRLRGLAVTSAKRVPIAPEYPTVAELGYPTYEAGNWYGILVPAKTPEETIAALRGAVLNALHAAETYKPLTELGYVLLGSEPDAFAAYIQAEMEKMARLLKDIRTQ